MTQPPSDDSVQWQTTSGAPLAPLSPPSEKRTSILGCAGIPVLAVGILVLLPIVGIAAGLSVRLFHLACGC